MCKNLSWQCHHFSKLISGVIFVIFKYDHQLCLAWLNIWTRVMYKHERTFSNGAFFFLQLGLSRKLKQIRRRWC